MGKTRITTGKNLDGVITVETALLMPVILLALIGLIYLDFHYINRMTALSSACEESITGTSYTDFLMPSADVPTRSEQDGDQERQITMTSQTKGLYSFIWDIQEQGTYKKVKPVKNLRRIHSALGRSG